MDTPAHAIDPHTNGCPWRDSPTLLNHELRTALNAILGFADLLAENEQLDNRQRRYAAHIRASGRRLLGLVEDVLDVARRTGGRIKGS